MTTFARPTLTIHPTNETTVEVAASPASITEFPVDSVAEAPVGPALIINMVVAEAAVVSNTVLTTDIVVTEASKDIARTIDTPLEPELNSDCENGTLSEPLHLTRAEESEGLMRKYWLMLLSIICFIFVSVPFLKSITKQTFYDALEHFSAAQNSPSTLQRATRSLSFWGKNAAADDDKDTEEKINWSVGLLQIVFLSTILELSNHSFSVVASSSGICLKIAEATVLHTTKILLPFDVMDMSGNLYDRVRPQMDPASLSSLRILTSPSTVFRLTETFAWNLVLRVSEDLFLPSIQRSVERAKETLTGAILAFMSLSRPLKKVALVLRALFILNSTIESKGIHPYHLKQLKGLMRDIHAFPDHKDMEPIEPLLAILVQIEGLLAQNNQRPVTAKTIVLATAKEGAPTIVSWVDDFIFSQAYYTLDPPPPKRA